jgi:hypothetical protein
MKCPSWQDENQAGAKLLRMDSSNEHAELWVSRVGLYPAREARASGRADVYGENAHLRPNPNKPSEIVRLIAIGRASTVLGDPRRLKYCTARSCFSAFAPVGKVPRFRRLPVFE